MLHRTLLSTSSLNLSRSQTLFKIRSKSSKRNYTSGDRVAYIVAGKRTPFGKFGEGLKDITPVDLSVIAVKGTLEQAGVSPELIDHVIFANVLPSTSDTIYGARHTALKVGAKVETPAYSVNRLCGSGIQAIADARYMIERGEADCVVAVGAENMSMAPHLVYGSRFGTRFGPLKTVDMLFDSLTDSYCGLPMAITAENLAEKYKVSRQECDEFAYNSHSKAVQAYNDGNLQGEIVSVPVKKGQIEKDEHVRYDCNLEQMTKLRASFKKDGTVTAGNASGIVDGAASVLVCSEKFVKEHGLTPIATVHECVSIGVPPEYMGIGPVDAIKALLEKTGLKLSDIDLVEVNEAFSSQALAVSKALELDEDKLNIWGGAVAIGHPLGASGVRITNTLARQLQKTGKKVGISSACIGGGQGIAMLIRSV